MKPSKVTTDISLICPPTTRLLAAPPAVNWPLSGLISYTSHGGTGDGEMEIPAVEKVANRSPPLLVVVVVVVVVEVAVQFPTTTNLLRR